MTEMNKRYIKSLSLTLCLVLAFSTFFGCQKKQSENKIKENENTNIQFVSYEQKASSFKKTETVFVNTDCYGKEESIIVSDWLHTEKGEVKLEDISDLENIVNAKSDELPIIKNDSVIWNMPTTDLYYKGTSNKPLPATLKISYSLDGKAISAKDLANKSGNIKINIDIKNNISKKAVIDNKEVTIYNPILVVGGFILPEDRFTAITSENAQCIGDGSKEIAVFVSMPGIKESLGIDSLDIESDALKLPTHFSVSAKATDFTMGNIYFAVIPLSDVGVNFGLDSSLNGIEDNISKITSIVNSVYSINPEKVIESIKNNENGIKELTFSIKQAAKLYEENKQLITVLKKYLTAQNIEKLKNLINSVNDMDLKKYQELFNNPLFQKFFKDLPTIVKDIDEVLPLIEAMSSDFEKPEVKRSLENLPATLKQLNSIIDTVEKNEELINSLLELLNQDNINKITEIIDAVQAANLESLIEDYSSLADNADSISKRFSAMLDYGKEYKIYSKAPENAETSVVFIYKTAAITKAESKKQVAAPPKEEKKGFFERIFG